MVLVKIWITRYLLNGRALFLEIEEQIAFIGVLFIAMLLLSLYKKFILSYLQSKSKAPKRGLRFEMD